MKSHIPVKTLNKTNLVTIHMYAQIWSLANLVSIFSLLCFDNNFCNTALKYYPAMKSFSLK